MEVSLHSIWSILVLAQGVQGMLASASAPTQGPLPSASAQTFFAAAEQKTAKVDSGATIEIVRAVEWRIPQKRTARSVTVGGMYLIPRLRNPQPNAAHAGPADARSIWVVDLP